MTTFGPYPGRVDSIHDGDTLSITMDLGFDFQIASHGIDGTPRLSCRLYGINAPELSTPEGKTALAFLQTLVKPGDFVKVVSHGYDKYGGRFDGIVVLSDGTDLSAAMLDSGHAVPMRG